MSSNITGVENPKRSAAKYMVEKLKRDAAKYMLEKGVADLGFSSSIIDRAFQLGRLDGGALVADKVESCGISVWTSGEADNLTKAMCKGHEEMKKLKEEAARFALSVLEKEAKGEKV